jgi:hypothetical protein
MIKRYAVFISLALSLAACGGDSGSFQSASCVSRSGYEALKTGMSPAQAAVTMGCEPSTSQLSQQGATTARISYWGQTGASPFIIVLFSNEKLINKEAHNL